MRKLASVMLCVCLLMLCQGCSVKKMNTEKIRDVEITVLEEEKIQFQKDKEIAEKRAEKAETELKKLEDRREFLQPVMDNVSKEIKEYGMIKTFLPEATALERAVTYRDKKIKPLFIEMKNKIGAMAAQVKELTSIT